MVEILVLEPKLTRTCSKLSIPKYNSLDSFGILSFCQSQIVIDLAYKQVAAGILIYAVLLYDTGRHLAADGS